ncbi:hypothetical protein SAMN05192529_11516 [Arachidicoccus rhizosphaerae]|uniref:Probable inorganic carbon transporter subunit DabA n=1 Tax=Arachidicoccus rhizosphaerae TaxID=551991 RepID=A0A1H4AJ09_9BACT|nr:DUF2309 domain-containing protein [Arachidicoccus rhizosphaerae]SEA35885.1 hypothetical protein SAMN05192529_11516 [Arachidicoccus rhizosphaerae]
MNYKFLNKVINEAAEVVGKTWPLYGFVTSNPLAGYEALPFFTALKKASPVFGGQTLPSGSVFRKAWQEKKIDEVILTNELNTVGIHSSIENTLQKMESVVFTDFPNDKHELDRLTVKWLSLFLDEGLAAWPMPFKDMGFYTSWRKLVVHDNDLMALARKNGHRLTTIPKTPEEALQEVLFDFEPEAFQEIFERHFAALPGWVGFIKYRVQNNSIWQQEYPISLLDYLAVRLWIASLIGAAIMSEEPTVVDFSDREIIKIQRCWLEAWEKSWQQRFFSEILKSSKRFDEFQTGPKNIIIGNNPNTKLKTGLAAQLVFCLDTRSERLRRILEQAGANTNVEDEPRYETFGSAGAFGIMMDYQHPETGMTYKSSPAVGASSYLVREKPVRDRQDAQKAYLKQGRKLSSYRYFLKRMKNILPSAFGYVEGSGLYYGAFLLLRLWSPNRAEHWLLKHKSGYEALYEPYITSAVPVISDRISSEVIANTKTGFSKTSAKIVLNPDLDEVSTLALYAHDFVGDKRAGSGGINQDKIEKEPSIIHSDNPLLQHHHHDVTSTIDDIGDDQKALIVKGTFDSCGWRSFAPLVVFTGHASKSANNPFASSLDCGACAGQPGKYNARTLAMLANNNNVRNILKKEYDIEIPKETFFIAAEHITSTDEVELFDQDIPASHLLLAAQLKKDLIWAQAQLTKERLNEPVNSSSIAKLKSNSWSESRPEWGLSGHKGYVIGPRSLTLKGEFSDCFMSSYDWAMDPDGNILKGIMQGPLVVVQWISNHYYFSTVDNQKFGGGSKIIHNITGKYGVVEGNGSDLKIGLPLQSVMKSDDEVYHDPIRISVLVQAPRRYIDQILKGDPKLKSLIEGGWILLFVMDPEQKNQIDAYKQMVQPL